MSDLPPPSADGAAIRLTMKTHPIGILLRMMKPRVTIDGSTEKCEWGTLTLPVAPGEHELSVSLPYAAASRRPPSLTLSVAPNSTVDVSYTGPASKTGSGKLRLA